MNMRPEGCSTQGRCDTGAEVGRDAANDFSQQVDRQGRGENCGKGGGENWGKGRDENGDKGRGENCGKGGGEDYREREANKELSELEAKIDRLERLLDSNECKLSAAERREIKKDLERLKDAADRLQGDINEGHFSRSDFESAKDEISRLERCADDEIRGLNDDIREYDGRVGEANKELSELEGKIDRLERLLDSNDSKLTAAEKREIKKDIERLKDAADGLRSDIDQGYFSPRDFKSVMGRLSGLERRADSEISALKNDIREYDGRVGEANKELSELEEKIDRLERLLDSNDSKLTAAEKREIRQDIERLETAADRVRSDVNQGYFSANDFDSAIAQLSGLERRADSEISALNSDIRQYDSRLAEANKELSDLDGNINRLENFINSKECKLSDAEIRDAKKDLERLERQAGRLRDEVNEGYFSRSDFESAMGDISRLERRVRGEARDMIADSRDRDRIPDDREARNGSGQVRDYGEGGPGSSIETKPRQYSENEGSGHRSRWRGDIVQVDGAGKWRDSDVQPSGRRRG